MAETADTAFGKATTNTAGNGAVAPVQLDEELVLFDALNEQLVVVPKAAIKAFQDEANQMTKLCRELTQAKDDLVSAEAKLDETQSQPFPDLTSADRQRAAVAKAQKAYDKAYAAIKSELGDKGYLAGSGNGKDLLELIPLWRRPPGQKAKHWAAKWTYVRWDRIAPKIRTEKLSSADKSQAKSFVKNGRIDTQALSKQLTKVSPKFKAEHVPQEWFTAGYVFPNLQAWAGALSLKPDEKDSVQFGTDVQLFRYFAGCGLGGEWKPSEGKIAANVSAKAELMLAKGEAAVSGYLPSPDGWAWSFKGPKSGKEFLIGAMLFKVELKLEAAAGASVAAELSLEVNYDAGDRAKVKGSPRPKRRNTGGQRKVRVDEPLAQANVGAEAFVGVKASGALEGSLQFRNPEKGSKFKAIAAVGPKMEGQAGAGAAANLSIDYRKGKFRIHAKAGLCWGLGAKGELSLEVDAKQLVDFLQYLFHALMNSGFEYWEVITEVGYKAATRLHVMLIAGAEDAYATVGASWDDFRRSLGREERRIALMERVLSNPETLRVATPEAHGILLHELTRHSELTFAYPANTGVNLEVLGRRKQAVLAVCRWAQCKSQFRNMVQHLHPEGLKGGFDGNLAGLLRFMEIGPLDSSLDDELRSIYARLPDEPPRGYAVAGNHTPEFMAQAKLGDAPIYAALMRELQVPGLGGDAGLA